MKEDQLLEEMANEAALAVLLKLFRAGFTTEISGVIAIYTYYAIYYALERFCLQTDDELAYWIDKWDADRMAFGK